jgi:PAS domain S-box-containing protein
LSETHPSSPDLAALLARIEDLERQLAQWAPVEERLRESEDRYRRITEAVTDYIYTVRVVDGKAAETQHGPACVAVTGYTSAEFANDPYLWYRMVAEEDKGAVEAEARRVLAGEQRPALEHRLIRKDGALRWVRNTPVLHHDEAGRLTSYDGLIQDITARKEAEQALSESEAQLNSILRTAPAGIGVVTKRMLVHMNERVGAMLGFSRRELIGRDARMLYPTQADFNYLEKIQDAQVAESGLASVETRWRRKDGSVLDVLLSLSLIDPARPIAGTVFAALDITDRKRAERELQQERAFLRRVIDAVPAFICVRRRDGSYALANRALAAAYDTTTDEIVGKREAELNPHRDEVESCLRADREVLEGGNEKAIPEEKFTYADGQEHWLATVRVPLRDLDGCCSQLLAVAIDITARRQAEQELLKTQKLESIALLAGGIAHDFNNILTGILGNVSLAKMYAPPNEALRARLSEAERAALRARDLTQQLLTFSKGGAPVRRPLRLASLVREAATFALRGSNLSVDFSLSNELWPSEVDAGQINQVIGNLVVNAIQAMPEGGTIEVTARNASIEEGNELALPSGRYVEIAVRDRGIGIPAQLLNRIFDPYFTTKQKGSGLGLATAYSILKSHGGGFAVKSEMGQGSTFSFYLPATDHAPQGEEEALPQPRRGRERVLVMDDETTVQEVAGEILSNHGYRVSCASDGETALMLFRQALKEDQPFEIVILDLTVPGGMGGRELLPRLRAIHEGFKAVVSSGYSNDPVMAQHEAHGFDAVLAKPYDVKGLLACVGSVRRP